MTIAPTLRKHLIDQQVNYDLIAHAATASSARTAQKCHIPGDCFAKAVVVKDEERHVVAVVPASHHVRIEELSRLLGRPVGLATEEEASKLFLDCELGAFPAIGYAYGLDMVVDDSIAEQSDVYFEGGDHSSVVHVTGEQFRKLTEGAACGQFSLHD
jgi:Ala-tRNA(Pro) deacylase